MIKLRGCRGRAANVDAVAARTHLRRPDLAGDLRKGVVKGDIQCRIMAVRRVLFAGERYRNRRTIGLQYETVVRCSVKPIPHSLGDIDEDILVLARRIGNWNIS